MDETAQAEAGHTGEDVGIGTDDGTGKRRIAHGMILGRVCTASPAGTVDAEARGRAGAPVPAAGQGQKLILARGDSGLKPEGRGRSGGIGLPEAGAGKGRSGRRIFGKIWCSHRKGPGPVRKARAGTAGGISCALPAFGGPVLSALPSPCGLVWRGGQKKEHPAGMLLLKVTHGAGVVRTALCGHEGKRRRQA